MISLISHDSRVWENSEVVIIYPAWSNLAWSVLCVGSYSACPAAKIRYIQSSKRSTLATNRNAQQRRHGHCCHQVFFGNKGLKENLGKLVHNISYQDNLFIYVYLIYFKQNMTIWVYYIRICEKNCHQISLGVSLLVWRCSGRWPGCLVIGGLEVLSNPKGLSRSNHPQKVL